MRAIVTVLERSQCLILVFKTFQSGIWVTHLVFVCNFLSFGDLSEQSMHLCLLCFSLTVPLAFLSIGATPTRSSGHSFPTINVILLTKPSCSSPFRLVMCSASIPYLNLFLQSANILMDRSAISFPCHRL